MATAAEEETAEHVSWQEEHVMGERGREVRYYLRRRDGERDIAVVGRERGMRHMVYQIMIRDRDVISLAPSVGRLRSKREVVDWLDSIVSGLSPHSSQTRPLVKKANKLDIETLEDNRPRKAGHVTESVWVGTPWTCRKRRIHYSTYMRNGVMISVNDFVFVLAEENKRLVAFLEDMYEDSRGNKMVVVQWFHKIDEVGFVLPHNINDREIFFSHCLQDLSIECIDGLATVLSPQHFEKLISHAQFAQLELFVCRSLFDNDEIKPFDITQIKGYWRQAILGQSTGTAAPPETHLKSFPLEGVVTRPRKRLRVEPDQYVDLDKLRVEPDQYVDMDLVVPKIDVDASKNFLDASVSFKLDKEVHKPTLHFAVGSQIEVLSQDSGLRGCWFRAVVIKKYKDKVKVQYEDIMDAEDEAKNLQEWLPASRFAVRDPLGLRFPGRTTIRPAPVSENEKLLLCPGAVVDAWWHDGWWEAVVLRQENEDKIRVYFPGEKQNSTFVYGDLRLSKEWVGNRWASVKERPDLVTSILSDLNEKQVDQTRIPNHNKSTVDDADKLGRNADKERTVIMKGDVFCNMEERCFNHVFSKADYFDSLKWKSWKRRTPCITNKRKTRPENKAIRVFDGFVIPGSLKGDHRRDCSFSSSVVPTFTSLVMSR